MVDIGDALNKAKDLLGKNTEKIEDAIDKAADAVQEKTPDQIDPMVDKAAEAGKDALGKFTSEA